MQKTDIKRVLSPSAGAAILLVLPPTPNLVVICFRMLQSAFLVFLLLSAANVGAYSGSELYRGENLLQPMPVPGQDWQVSSASEDQTRSVRWSHSGSGESLTTTIMRGSNNSVARFREINDSAGKTHCESFSSRTINAAKTNGYERAIWLAECGQKGGKFFTVLHQYIAGRDSSYYLTKRWSNLRNEQALDVWLGYFESISLCDTRKRRSAPCPELTKKDGN